MVAIEGEEGLLVEGIDEQLLVCHAFPIVECADGGGNIVGSVGSEIVENGFCVGRSRPYRVGWRDIGVHLVKHHVEVGWVLAEVVAKEAINALRSNQKPLVLLVAGGDDGVVVIVRVGGRVEFIVDALFHIKAAVVFGIGRQAADGQVGDAVAVHVGIRVVGGELVGVALRYGDAVDIRLDAKIGVGVAVAAEKQHGSGRNRPMVVGVEKVVSDGFRGVAATFRNGRHLGRDALAEAELFQGVGPSQKNGVVWSDDEVFAAFLA